MCASCTAVRVTSISLSGTLYKMTDGVSMYSNATAKKKLHPPPPNPNAPKGQKQNHFRFQFRFSCIYVLQPWNLGLINAVPRLHRCIK